MVIMESQVRIMEGQCMKIVQRLLESRMSNDKRGEAKYDNYGATLTKPYVKCKLWVDSVKVVCNMQIMERLSLSPSLPSHTGSLTGMFEYFVNYCQNPLFVFEIIEIF